MLTHEVKVLKDVELKYSNTVVYYRPYNKYVERTAGKTARYLCLLRLSSRREARFSENIQTTHLLLITKASLPHHL